MASFKYSRNPLIQVIMQIRFPSLLEISNKDPVEFQQKIRTDFPLYDKFHDHIPKKFNCIFPLTLSSFSQCALAEKRAKEFPQSLSTASPNIPLRSGLL